MTQYVINSAGEVRLVQPTPINSTSNLRGCLEQVNRRQGIGSTPPVMMGEVLIYPYIRNIIYARRLKKLHLNCVFTVGGTQLLPEPQPVGEGHENKFHLTWSPPENMHLWFCLSSPPVTRLTPYENGTVYLFAVDISDGGTWALPLPNLYRDGRVCTDSRCSGYDIEKILNIVVGRFNGSLWNLDVVNSEDRGVDVFMDMMQGLFSYGKDLVQEWSEQDTSWDDHCWRLSNAIADSLVEHVGYRSDDADEDIDEKEVVEVF